MVIFWFGRLFLTITYLLSQVLEEFKTRFKSKYLQEDFYMLPKKQNQKMMKHLGFEYNYAASKEWLFHHFIIENKMISMNISLN